MTELDLTPEQTILLLPFLIGLLFYLYHHRSCFQLDCRRKEKGKNSTPTLTNEHYGAYIQLQGKYYN